jgi:protein AroM
MSKLGVITIGEAPRNDITPIFEKYLQNGQEVVQVGVLDGMTKQEAEEIIKPENNEYTLVSRFVNGDSVVMSRNKITPILQRKIDLLESKGCRRILLLCTGVFYGLKTKKAILIEPEKIIPKIVAGLVKEHQLGIIGPLKKQQNLLDEKWSELIVAPLYITASPYNFNEKDFQAAAQALKEQNVDLILLDCMGYVEEMKQIVSKEVGDIPVMLSNALIVKIISELI